MASEKEIEAARREFLHVIAEEIRQGNKDWVIGPCINQATKAALEAAEAVRPRPWRKCERPWDGEPVACGCACKCCQQPLPSPSESKSK